MELLFEDIRSEKEPSKKTLALMKSMNMDIWVNSTSSQLFRRGS